MSEERREEGEEGKKERNGKKKGKKERKGKNSDLTQGKERHNTQRCECVDVCMFVRVLPTREGCETQGEKTHTPSCQSLLPAFVTQQDFLNGSV